MTSHPTERPPAFYSEGRWRQLVIVDHEPPARSEDQIIVRYTRRADVPPYGLIDDQTDEPAAQ